MVCLQTTTTKTSTKLQCAKKRPRRITQKRCNAMQGIVALHGAKSRWNTKAIPSLRPSLSLSFPPSSTLLLGHSQLSHTRTRLQVEAASGKGGSILETCRSDFNSRTLSLPTPFLRFIFDSLMNTLIAYPSYDWTLRLGSDKVARLSS
jgi:hypothetical protein